MTEDRMTELRMTEPHMTLPPIRREVLVAASAAVAFEVFTAEIGGWWPLGEHGVFGPAATVAFEDGRLVERSPDGDTDCWGEVTTWAPPHRLAFTWHPGNPSCVTEVIVTFEPREAQTLVTLVHGGWEAFADPDAARTAYDGGWPAVLAAYRDQVHPGAADTTDPAATDPAAPAADGTDPDAPDPDDTDPDDTDPDDTDPTADTWVALLHRPGPGTPTDERLFEEPLFGQHVAFLQRMQSAGYLVAAGPLQGRPGEGMAILRLPGADRLEEAARLANEDDLSVANGLFVVTVRQWQVMVAAPG